MLKDKNKFIFNAVPYNDIILERGDGCWVYDTEDNKYLDLNSGQFCLAFGHNDEGFKQVVIRQLNKIYHTNTATITPEVLQACEDIASVTGGTLNKTIFLSTGSEANECAMRYAKFATGKNKVVSLAKGYHGLTLASQQVTMRGIWARPQPVDTLFIDDFSLQNLKKNFEKADDVAAVIVEPILGVGGIIIPPDEFFVELRNICNKKDILLIFDECQTGFGRTGNWFSYQNLGIEPDILVCAKAMGLGFAVSSVTFSEKVAEKIEGKITHFSSHQNDPLSCAIVSYVINTIKKNNYIEKNIKAGGYLINTLKRLADKHEIISEPRGKGLMCAFDIKDEVFEKDKTISKKFINAALKEGLLLQAVRQGRTFRLMPAYVITEKEIDFMENAINKALSSINS